MFRHLPALVGLLLATSASAQTPQPFPRPGAVTSQAPSPAPPASPPPAPSAPPQRPPASAAQSSATPALPFPVFQGAQFIASYDAGRGQRYYMFGTTAAFADVVTYYRNELKERGNLVFAEPPTHMFEIGRFRDDAMAFPPGVTVKDWTWGGSQGYPNPVKAAQPARFPTVIMIVPPPVATPSAPATPATAPAPR